MKRAEERPDDDLSGDDQWEYYGNKKLSRDNQRYWPSVCKLLLQL